MAAPMADGDRARWDERYRGAAGREHRGPSSFLLALDGLLPRGPGATGLDVAGGSGRNALWLARRGLDVTLADVSPVALDLARASARLDGLALRLVETDLEHDPLPAGPFDVILSVDFLWRPLFAAVPTALAPDGLLVVAHPTRRNLERHAHPSARFLLDEGELPSLLGRGLTVLQHDEGWFDDRHEARLVARKG